MRRTPAPTRLLTIREESVVVRLRGRRGLPVQTELKWHLLVRTQAIEQWDRRRARLEVEVTHRVLQPLEEAGHGWAVDVALAGERDRALDRLPVGQVNVIRDVLEPDDAVA